MVPAALLDSVFFLVLVFFDVVDVWPEAAWGALVSVDSVAGFFFFLVLLATVDSLCVGSVDCKEMRPCAEASRPTQLSKSAANIAKYKFFFHVSFPLATLAPK